VLGLGAIVGAASRRGRADNTVWQIDPLKCIGCGKCVVGCALQNGSFFLQVRHDRCLNCNECSIAVACPADAFRRVPADQPYLIKSRLLDKDRER